MGNSGHGVVSVSIDFVSNSKRNVPFHWIAYDYSRAEWDGLCGHLRDVPPEDIFELSASAAASDFVSGFWLKLMYISFIKYQIKPHSSLWILAACAAAIAHRNNFFRLYR